MSLAPSEIKSCCASSYADPLVHFLLGAAFHPGGSALTSTLLAELQVDADSTVLDVASGIGTSAVLAAQELGCGVVGVELSEANVVAAGSRAREAGIADRVAFVHGDAESLPLADASVDGVLCECAFCLFPDKATAVAELVRVMRPGARLALSDVTADTSRLPDELSGLGAWVACVADARSLPEIAALVGAGGLTVERTDDRSEALESLVDRVEARLRLARFLAPELASELSGSITRGLELIPVVRSAVAEGALGYGFVIAVR